jgi:hypothetical protein
MTATADRTASRAGSPIGRLMRRLVPTPFQPPAYVPPALSAAATAPPPAMTPILAQNTPQVRPWQERAWDYYRAVGCARQGVDWLANGLSRCHLFIGLTQPDGAGDPVPLPRDDGQAGAAGRDNLDLPDQATVALAEEILAELHDGPVGQRDMLARLSVHLLVPGESWLVGYPTPPPVGKPADGVDNLVDDATVGDAEVGTSWAVVSRTEWQVEGDEGIRVKLPRHPNRGPDGWVTFRTTSTVVVPVYQPDPQDAGYATSRFEAVVRDLDELDGLSRRVAADILSRLAGAGVLLIPESAMMPNPGGSNPSAGGGLHGDPVIAALQAAASTAIQNPDSPSATVPIMLRVSDEAIAKLQHMTFSTPLDAAIPGMREDARRSVAVGLDIPSSIVTGVEDLNHWASWAVDEQAVKSHLGPLASLICTTLTREILWPALRANGHDTVERLCIWWNASEIILRPDRSVTALAAQKQELISDAATRRETGFTEDDKPTQEDLNRHRPPAPQQAPAGDQAGPPARGGSTGGAVSTAKGGQPTPGHRPNPPAPTSPAATGDRPARRPAPAS